MVVIMTAYSATSEKMVVKLTDGVFKSCAVGPIIDTNCNKYQYSSVDRWGWWLENIFCEISLATHPLINMTMTCL